MVILVIIALTTSDRKNNDSCFSPKEVERWAVWDMQADPGSCILFLRHLSIDLLTIHSPRYLLSFRQNFHAAIGFLFSCSVVSNSLRPHGLQHTRFSYPSLSPRVCSNSCSLSWWCHPTISSSVVCFSSCLQSFWASRSFPVSQLFISGGQSIGASALASVLPMNIQGWYPLVLTVLICLLRDSQESSPAPQFESITSLALSLFLWSNPYIRAWLLKNHCYMGLCQQSDVSAF